MLASLRKLALRVVEQGKLVLIPPSCYGRVPGVIGCGKTLPSSQSVPAILKKAVTNGTRPRGQGGGPTGRSVVPAAPPIFTSLFSRIGPVLSSAVRRITSLRGSGRVLYRDTAPLFALVGVTLATSHDDCDDQQTMLKQRGFVTRKEELEAICCSVRAAVTRCSWLDVDDDDWSIPLSSNCAKTKENSSVADNVNKSSPSELCDNENHEYSLDDIEFDKVIGQGCNAVVYAARWKNETTSVDKSPDTPETVRPSSSSSDDNYSSGNSKASQLFKPLLDRKRHNSESQILKLIDSNMFVNFKSSIEVLSQIPLQDTECSLSLEVNEEPVMHVDMHEPFENITDYSNCRLQSSILSCSSNLVKDLPESSLLMAGRFGGQSAYFNAACSKKNTKKVRFEIDSCKDRCETDSDVVHNEMTDVTPSVPKELLITDGNNESSVNRVDYPLAVKLIFNYEAASNAPAILSALYRELLPAQRLQLDTTYDAWRSMYCRGGEFCRLPRHPYIVSMPCAFVSRMPLLRDAHQLYPTALPPRLHSAGLGRNMTLFCVMRRYQLSLDEYLLQHNPSPRTGTLLLAQLLEALLHLSTHNVAHRDLKPDNILISIDEGLDYPHLVLTDFGCCIVSSAPSGLVVPFISRESEPRQGNTALMAPEVKTAKPGLLQRIDFSRNDLWAAGALAYQFYGLPCPFLSCEASAPLDSASYREVQLPNIQKGGAPPAVARLVADLLRRRPVSRPPPHVAATLVQLSLWAPSSWLSRRSLARPKHDQILEWLLSLTSKVICDADCTHRHCEFRLLRTFLTRVRYSDITDALSWNRVF